jgi:hypothetical protein
VAAAEAVACGQIRRLGKQIDGTGKWTLSQRTLGQVERKEDARTREGGDGGDALWFWILQSGRNVVKCQPNECHALIPIDE